MRQLLGRLSFFCLLKETTQKNMKRLHPSHWFRQDCQAFRQRDIIRGSLCLLDVNNDWVPYRWNSLYYWRKRSIYRGNMCQRMSIQMSMSQGINIWGWIHMASTIITSTRYAPDAAHLATCSLKRWFQWWKVSGEPDGFQGIFSYKHVPKVMKNHFGYVISYALSISASWTLQREYSRGVYRKLSRFSEGFERQWVLQVYMKGMLSAVSCIVTQH